MAANDLIQDEKLLEEYLSILSVTRSDLESLYSSIAVTCELTIRVKARIVSYGETLMAVLMNSALKSRGQKSVFIDSKNLISLADELDNYEPIDKESIENCEKLIKPKLKDNDFIVVQGFLGSTPDGKVMTLGRGGSDYSATLLASYLNAEIGLFYIKKSTA